MAQSDKKKNPALEALENRYGAEAAKGRVRNISDRWSNDPAFGIDSSGNISETPDLRDQMLPDARTK